MYSAYIQGIGSYVPEGKLTNADLEKLVDTQDDWIVTRTGISERRIADPSQATSDLALHASQRALEDAGIAATELDMIIVATETPDYLFPSVACQLQHLLKWRNVAAFDVHNVCSGFITALQVAEQYVKVGKYKKILVVGADTFSRIVDYTDRGTCILFSDGAGAVVVSQGDPSNEAQTGIIDSALHADGEYLKYLYVPGGGSIHPDAEEGGQKPKVVMEGSKIFKLAVNAMTRTVKSTLAKTGHSAETVDWIVPHQANQRIMDAVAKNLSYPNEKVISTIKHYGNNSAATIPLAMDIAIKDGRIKRGDTLMLTAFGGGLSWGSMLLKY